MNPPHSPMVFRKRLFLFFLIFLASILLMKGMTAPTTAQSMEERELEDRIPKHLPIKVKIKKEKEKAFKDAKNEKWMRDLEVEVTNIGDKPIYFLDFLVDMPEITDPGGTIMAFSLMYGRHKLGSIESKAEPDDIPLKPGETLVLKAHNGNVRGWDLFRRKYNKPQPKKLILHFRMLSFGDGTGFESTGGIPVPEAPKQKSGIGRCEQEQNKSGPRTVKRQRTPPRTWPATYSTDILPAKSLLAKFLSADLSHPISIKSSSQPDMDCCPGNDCGRFKTSIEYLCYGCPPIRMVTSAFCSDQTASCRTVSTRTISCTVDTNPEFEYFCTELIASPCGSAAPTPTPYPTPTPEPTPTPTPTPCPQVCSELYPAINAEPCTTNPLSLTDPGCPPGYKREGNCCRPIPCPSPTPEPPACTGTLSWLGAPDCRWLCFSGPLTSNCDPGEASDCTASGGKPDPECDCTFASPFPNPYTCPSCSTPIIVDTEGNGFALTNNATGVRFDLNSDGQAELLSWTSYGSDDSFLVLDRNANGRIDDGRELFGNFTPQPPSANPHGFLALAEFDQPQKGGNLDKVIDRSDSIFRFLRLWRDANHNGMSEATELYTLGSLGIDSISVDYKESKQVDQYGNQFRYRAKVDDAKQSKAGRWAWDVFLVRAP